MSRLPVDGSGMEQRVKRALTLLAVAWLGSSHAQAAEAVRNLTFPAGAAATTARGVIRGDQGRSFVVQASAGQVLQVLFAPSNRACYFNAFEPGSAEAAHIGSVSGNEFGRSPTRAGAYRFQVYLMRSAARRGETCRFSLSVELTGAATGEAGASAGVSDRQMRDTCRANVAKMYAVRSSQIRTGRIAGAAEGPRIDGTVDKRAEGVKRFRCRFGPERQFLDVMAMTPDGE
jgi:hypothetical protein